MAGNGQIGVVRRGRQAVTGAVMCDYSQGSTWFAIPFGDLINLPPIGLIPYAQPRRA